MEEALNAAGPLEASVGLHDARRVLDPCCGSRMMWFDRQHADVVFGDQREEVLTVTDNSRGNASGLRTIRVPPSVQFARVMAALDEPDFAERHVQLGQFYRFEDA